MKKQVVFFCTLLACAPVFGQKGKFETIKVKTVQYPTHPLPESFQTYQVAINNQTLLESVRAKEDAIYQKINFYSFKKVTENGDLAIRITLGTAQALTPAVKTVEYESGTPPNVKKYYRYRVEASYNTPVSYEVTDRQGKLMDKENLSPTNYYQTPEYATEAEAKSHYQRSGTQEVNTAMSNTLLGMVSSIGYDLGKKYDYRTPEQEVYFARLKSDKDAAYDREGYEKAFHDVELFAKEHLIRPGDEAIMNGLKPSMDFWTAQLEKLNPENKSDRHLVAVSSHNLALIYGWLNEYEKAESYAALMDKADVKDAYGSIMKKTVADRKKAFAVHNQFKQDLQAGKVSLYRSAQTAPGPSNIFELQSARKEQQSLDNRAILKGYMVMTAGDTVRGEFIDFDLNIKRNQVEFIPVEAKKTVYKPAQLKMLSVDGQPYETYSSKLMKVIHDTPSLKVVSMPNTFYHIFYFKKEDVAAEYKSLDREDASAYLNNYKKKLSEVFKNCEPVKKRILDGEFELKTESLDGMMKAIQAYENSCGSKTL